jgi:hypothetical protein
VSHFSIRTAVVRTVGQHAYIKHMRFFVGFAYMLDVRLYNSTYVNRMRKHSNSSVIVVVVVVLVVYVV